MKVRLPVLLAVAAFLLLAVVAARGVSGIPTGDPGIGGGSGSNADGPPIGPPPVAPDAIAYGAGTLVVLVVIGVLFGLAVVVVAIGGIGFHRDKRMRSRTVLADDVVDSEEAWLVRAKDRALAELDRKIGGPPSDAVIAAWVQLEESAKATGIERQPHQTPTEFTAAVLAGQQADEKALSTLKDLYHRARFGQAGSVTDEDARQARQALEAIS